ncbi:MAG: dTDP-4-dehydrorhamnose 3,5-epimerase [Gloeobacteraceae cyanobacterium ES-bin-144]|nr:dTDP-4-dehydrorhamnose 3,5-epimerase [Verrucomicrobiales bacterium]
MKFTETPLKGAYIIELEKRGDDRGWFARYFCELEYNQHGLNHHIVQINDSVSKYKGTLRGMHYQLAPKAEDKIVRCLRGALFDCIIDLRPDSATFLQHFSVELTAENRTMLYVPKGFAHGFMTLEPDTEAFYLVTEYYSPEHERGLRYNDPKFGISWPMAPTEVSDKDANHPDFNPEIHFK